MNKQRIADMVDRNIITSLGEGHAIQYIKEELGQKMNKYVENIRQYDKSVDVLKLLLSDPETITPTRTRYQIMYINQCKQRVKDLDWVAKNKSKFPKLSRSQVFKMIKLKEKLSEENALPF
jgi:hypothetical protein